MVKVIGQGSLHRPTNSFQVVTPVGESDSNFTYVSLITQGRLLLILAVKRSKVKVTGKDLLLDENSSQNQ